MKRSRPGSDAPNNPVVQKAVRLLVPAVVISEEERLSQAMALQDDAARFPDALNQAIIELDPALLRVNFHNAYIRGSILACACRLYDDGRPELLNKLVENWAALPEVADLSVLVFRVGHDPEGVNILWFAADKARVGYPALLNKICEHFALYFARIDLNNAATNKGSAHFKETIFNIACDLAHRGQASLLNRVTEYFSQFPTMPNVNAFVQSKGNLRYKITPLWDACKLVESGITNLADVIVANFSKFKHSRKPNINYGPAHDAHEQKGASVFWFAAYVAWKYHYPSMLNAILKHMPSLTCKIKLDSKPKVPTYEYNSMGLYWQAVKLAVLEQPALLDYILIKYPGEPPLEMRSDGPSSVLQRSKHLNFFWTAFVLATKGSCTLLNRLLLDSVYLKKQMESFNAGLLSNHIVVSSIADAVLMLPSGTLILKFMKMLGLDHPELKNSESLAVYFLRNANAIGISQSEMLSNQYLIEHKGMINTLEKIKALLKADELNANQLAKEVGFICDFDRRFASNPVRNEIKKQVAENLLVAKQLEQASMVIRTYKVSRYREYPYEHLFALMHYVAICQMDAFGQNKRLAMRYGLSIYMAFDMRLDKPTDKSVHLLAYLSTLYFQMASQPFGVVSICNKRAFEGELKVQIAQTDGIPILDRVNFCMDWLESKITDKLPLHADEKATHKGRNAMIFTSLSARGDRLLPDFVGEVSS